MGAEALYNPSSASTSANGMTDQGKYTLSYTVGVAENTNVKYRPTMEDVHTYVENFAERLDWGYFAIFDGHAGKQAAKWCGQHLHSIVERKLVVNEGDDVRNVLNEAFLEADDQMSKSVKGASGCTAAVALLRWELPDQPSSPTVTSSNAITSSPTDETTSIQAEEKEEKEDAEEGTTTTSTTKTDKAIEDATTTAQDEEDTSKQTDSQEIDLSKYKRMLYTANVGDTRIVLSRDGRAIRLTYDHKASDTNEARRVERAGGVVMKARVNGMLAVTRSLGDQYFKELVIGSPYTTAVELDMNRDKFLIIACDGLWDVVSDQQACDLVKGFTDATQAAKALVDHALGKLTTDNVTVMVIYFR
ncbi:Protein phosphatase 2C 1 [Cyberlindnera fabianii]|nr:Protein phosphatase 2C 1 [Cyberlindnera fabianii]